MAEPRLVMRGANRPIAVLINNTPFDEQDVCRKITVSPKHKSFEDKYLGRERDRHDEQIRGWNFTMEFDHADNVMKRAWLAAQAAREARQPIPPIAVAVTYEMRDGTDETWLLHGSLVMAPDEDSGASDDTSTVKWSGMCEEYTQSL